MTKLLDTEGKPIPPDCDGYPLFDADLCDWDDGNGPMLVINVPDYFETSHGTYDSAGVVHAPLKDVLEEYLRAFAVEDGGSGIDAFAAWLHEYADRLKAANKRITDGGI